VLMADGSRKRISDLAVGDNVMCLGRRVGTVECRISSSVFQKTKMCHLKSAIGGCWITFEHPILFSDVTQSSLFDADGAGVYDHLYSLDSDKISHYNLSWALPMDICPVENRYQSHVHNFILNAHHTLNVSGHWCCTLGHNYKGYNIEHEFWGNLLKLKSFLQNNSNTYPNVQFKSSRGIAHEVSKM